MAQRTWLIVASQLGISDWSPAEKRIYNVFKRGASDNTTARVPLCKVPAEVSGPIVLCDPGDFDTRFMWDGEKQSSHLKELFLH